MSVGDWQELDWSDQYWREDPPLLQHTEQVNRYLGTRPQTAASRRIKRDAAGALRGSVLRTELYALDGSPRESRPYTVSESPMGSRSRAAVPMPMIGGSGSSSRISRHSAQRSGSVGQIR